MNDNSKNYRRALCLLALALIGVQGPPAFAQQTLGSDFWQTTTAGINSGPHSTQDAAADAWIAKSSWLRNGPCGALGTPQYRVCPVKNNWGQPANIDVPLLCPRPQGGNDLSPTGLECPTYFVTAIPPPLGECCSANPQGDPINPATGNVYLNESDLSVGGLSFRRYYNSADKDDVGMGPGWRHSFSRRIEADAVAKSQPYPMQNPRYSPTYFTQSDACTVGFSTIKSYVPAWATATTSFSNGTCRIVQGSTTIDTLPVLNAHRNRSVPIATTSFRVYRDDGRQITFRKDGSLLIAPTGVKLKLIQTASGFEVRDADDSVETYDTNGRLVSVVTRNGITLTAQYGTNGKLSGITNNFGQTFSLNYDASNRVSGVVAPDLSTTQFGYDAQSRLSTITSPDATVRTYLYELSSLPNLLTGLNDESSTRLSTWGYDNLGRGTSTQEAGGANAVSLVYNADGSIVSTDAFGVARTFTFKRVGHRHAATSISGSRCATCNDGKLTNYDAAGHVSATRDYNDNLVCIQSEAARGLELVRVEGFAPSASACPANLATYSPAAGTRERKIVTAWHATFRVPLSITELNRVTSFTHDASGNVLTLTVTDTSVTPNVSRTWTYTYSSFGQVLTEDGPRTDVSDITTFAYYTCTTGSQCGQLNTVTNALGHVTTYNAYNAHGQPTQITDPNGLVTSFAYDLRQRLTDRCVESTLPGCSGGELTHLDYWPTGLIKKATNPDSSFVEFTYDAAHRLTQVKDGALNKIVYTLDAMGNRTAENTYDPGNALRRTHTQVFNTLNQLWKDVNAAGTAAVTTTFGYDSDGNPTSVSAPLSRVSASLYDELNRLKQVTDPASGVTQFGYDANDNLTSVTDPRSLVTSYTYNGFGDLKTQTSPDTGLATNTYDSGGNLDTSTDARGAVTDYGYDVANRVTSASFTLAGVTDQTISYGYDAGTNQKGHITSASDANHSLAWSYDTQGRITGKGQTIGGVTLALGYGYNAAGKLANVVLPSGANIGFGYNTNGQVTSLTLNSSTTILSGITYDPFGPITSWTWGNGSAANRGFDTDGKITQIDNANGASLKTYAYDDASRITGISDAGDSSLSWTYGYDNLDRLNSASKTGTTQGWTYDANGNRLTQTGSTPSTFTNSGTSNRVSSVTGSMSRIYAYDNAGNALSYAGATFTYNNRGRMATAANGGATATYTYNALGQRIRRTTSSATTLYVYDEAGHLAGEYTAAGALIQETVWLGDIPVATLRPNGSGGLNLYYVHADHLSTPRLVTDTSNNVRWRWDSDPFGTTVPNENPTGLGLFAYNLRFPGQQYDPIVGLHYNYFRDYDPAVGRYIESDPIGLGGGINTFAYGESQPSGLVDPLGLAVYRGPGNYYSDVAPSAGCEVAVFAGDSIASWIPCPPILGMNDYSVSNSQGMSDFPGCPPESDDGFSISPWDAVLLFNPFGRLGRGFVQGAFALGKTARAGVRSFRSFSSLKNALGPAGPGKHWHHIVEQTPGNISRFGPEAVHNTQNVMRLDAAVHVRVSGFYSSIQPQVTGSTRMTVRQWMSTQSFEAQQAFGQQVLRQFGGLQ